MPLAFAPVLIRRHNFHSFDSDEIATFEDARTNLSKGPGRSVGAVPVESSLRSINRLAAIERFANQPPFSNYLGARV